MSEREKIITHIAALETMIADLNKLMLGCDGCLVEYYRKTLERLTLSVIDLEDVASRL